MLLTAVPSQLIIETYRPQYCSENTNSMQGCIKGTRYKRFAILHNVVFIGTGGSVSEADDFLKFFNFGLVLI